MQISFFGEFRVSRQGQALLPFKRVKVMALLMFLALERERSHSRSALMGLLWPELPETKARNNLRVALSRLRGRLAEAGAPDTLLHATRHEVRFQLDDSISFDVATFQTLLAVCDQCRHGDRSTCSDCIERQQTAVSLYKGPLLHGFYLDGAADFDEWLFVQREQFHLQVMGVLAELTAALEDTGRLAEAIQTTRRQLELDPLHDSAQRRLLRQLAITGETNAALTYFANFKKLLKQELGVEPDQEMVALVAQIEQGTVTAVRSDATLPPSNLPENLTPFIGREEEVAQLNERLAERTYRLISLVGPGGMGKTRLALEVAHGQIGRFADGVFFVGLVGVERVENVPTAVAEALTLPMQRNTDTTQQLLAYLKNKEMLLVIDNIEHVIDSVDLLLQLLRHCPQLVLLVTTRTQLNVQAEDLFRLHGLPVPDAETGEEAARFASVRLFCDRAYRLQKSFKLTPANRDAVASICRSVEGMPLALELAASWIRDLDVAALAQSLAEGLDFLQSTGRDMMPQHRSMRAVFDHSWRLLAKAEQELLAQLSVFRGSFSAEAAAIIAEATTMGLVHLRMHSLIRRAGNGRYALHELTRQYAAEKLVVDAAHHTEVQERFTRYYLTKVAEREAMLDGPRAQTAVVEMRTALDNVRAAWQTGLELARWPLLDEALVGLMQFYRTASLWSEALRLCRESLDHLDAAQTSKAVARLRCHLQCQYSYLLARLVKPEALPEAEKALSLAKGVDDAFLLANAHEIVGQVLIRNGRFAVAEQKLGEADKIARNHNFPAILVQLLSGRGLIAYFQTHYEQAQQYGEAAIALAEQEGVAHGAKLTALQTMGNIALDRGDYVKALHYHGQSVTSFEELGNRRDEAVERHMMANTQVAVGLFEAAIAHERRAIVLFQKVGDDVMESFARHVLADGLRQQGKLVEALVEAETALSLLTASNEPMANGYAHLNLALVLFDLARYSEADSHFALASTHFGYVERHSCVHEAEAGRALAALRQGESETARAAIEPLLPHLPDTKSAGGDRPIALFLACYQVLDAVGDGRAADVLQRGQRYLVEMAAKIDDEALRRSFLENVPHNLELQAAWDAIKK